MFRESLKLRFGGNFKDNCNFQAKFYIFVEIQIRRVMNTKSGVVIYNYMDIFFCCYVEDDKFCEDRVYEHILVYICSGKMTLATKDKRYHLKKGDSFFLKRNHILRKIKQPDNNGEPFKGLFLQLKMPFLETI